jgi:hypothetical protein
MSVYTKLNEARAKFHALQLKKTGKNQRYNYFELGDFLIPGLQVFKDAGLCSVVAFTDAMASMRIVDVETGEEIVITSPMGSASLPNCHVVQNIGATETYQRRYLWIAALEIVEHDAVDASDGPKKEELGTPADLRSKDMGHSATKGAWNNITPQQQKEIQAFIDQLVTLVDAGQMDEAWALRREYQMDADEQVAYQDRLPRKTRLALQAFIREQTKEAT